MPVPAAYPKRLIEVDLPIKRISAHSRREKSIRHGHISTLHIWWARRPLAACRAVICASLWPDPADESCPASFREAAEREMRAFAKAATTSREITEICSDESWRRYGEIAKGDKPIKPDALRGLLLDFIGDAAAWEASTNKHFLDTERNLTQAAHEALGGAPGTRPLVIDPFAGGGAIPLEALRVGADAFASDLNPVPVLLNKVALEYIPKHGTRLAAAVRKWGQWVREQTEEKLSRFYPHDPDGAVPMAYLWARTIMCEGPGCGAEVPLIRSPWIARKKGKSIALHLTPSSDRKRVDFELLRNPKAKEVGTGTVARGSATCPCCGFTTPVASVRQQLKGRRGGAADARLLAVVTVHSHESGRYYRLATDADLAAVDQARNELKRRQAQHSGELSFTPDEEICLNEIRRISVPIYGMTTWGDIFSPRQALALGELAEQARTAPISGDAEDDPVAPEAIRTCLGLIVDRQADATSSLSRWHVTGEKMTGMFGRQALGMVWDFAEVNPFADASGGLAGAIKWVAKVCDANATSYGGVGHVGRADAAKQLLPDDSANALVTDPPYYDAVPYAHLSDLFYVWLRRTVGDLHPGLFQTSLVEKDAEIVVDRPHHLSTSTKDIRFYEEALQRAFAEARRVVRPDGVAVIVFASKTTASWEAVLKAIVDAGWVIGGSWPVDTEMGARVSAQGQARLASSVHIFCRPRENPDGSVRMDEVGDWRDVLVALPKRIHDWLPRLADEGVVGADAIFACLGPALEIFSQYSSVEKASGEQVYLQEYLEHVWGAVSKEALNMIFSGGDATGFEEDARLTAMWLWTLTTGNGQQTTGHAEEDAGDEDEDDAAKPTKTPIGLSLEYDAARKIAQGLGAHLEKLRNVAEVKGDTARLLSVAERTKALFGKDQAEAPKAKRKKAAQRSLFAELDEAEAADGGWGEKSVSKVGETVLDRLHQSMILFAAGRSEAMRRFLVEEGIGRDQRFWRLAQALSALYLPGTDEKRWVDGVLARKKGLGF